MPTPTKGRRLGGSAAHQQHMLANLAAALFEHGKITTTEARARRLRPVAERLITFAKRGDLHARRHVLTVVNKRGVVKTLFDEIGPGYAGRDGGYTRITKIGPRKGDNAAMAVIELVREEPDAKPRRRRARRTQPAAGRAAGRAQAVTTDEAAAGEPPAGDTAAEAAAGTDVPAAAGADAAGAADPANDAAVDSAAADSAAEDDTADDDAAEDETADDDSGEGGSLQDHAAAEPASAAAEAGGAQDTAGSDGDAAAPAGKS